MTAHDTTQRNGKEHTGSSPSRRRFIAALGGSAGVALAGCTGEEETNPDPTQTTGAGTKPNGGAGGGTSAEGGTTEKQPAVTPVSVSAEDYSLGGSTNVVTIRYATNTTAELNPPNVLSSTPEPGNKYVVVHGKVTVESQLDRQIDVYASVLGLRARGVVHERTPISNLPGFSQTVVPGTTFDAWMSFQVPEDVTKATLVTSDVRAWFKYSTQILFKSDASLSATLPEE